LSSEYPPAKVYGLGRYVHGLARAQAAAGDEVFVLTNSSGGAEDGVTIDGVRLHRIAFPNPPRPANGHGEVLQFNHGLVCRFLDRRAVFGAVDVVASHDWLTALAAREIARVLGAPLVVTFHDEVVGKHFGNLDPEALFVRDLEALTAHDATRVIANSRFIAGEVSRHYGVASRRIETVHGGIDPALLDVAAPDRVADFRSVLAGEDDLLIGYCGRFDQEKGLGTLAEAALAVARARPDVRFVFAGSGREEAALRERLAPLGPRAKFLGYLGGEALAYFYRAVDVTVVPSIYEPLGLVALEGMLAEAAVVVSAAGGLPELVEHEKSGLVVPPGDAGALAEALVRLAEDALLRERLGAAGAARARTEFSWSRIAGLTREAYVGAIMDGKAVLGSQRPTEPTQPLVTVTVATHEALVHVETALRSLFQRTDYPALEAVVVDNGSSEPALARLRAIVAELRARGHEVRLLENKENRLFSAAQNQAIRDARGEYVCLLNDDTEIPAGSEGWLRGLVWAVETLGAGTVTPVTLQREGRVYCAGAFSTGGHHLKDVPDSPGLLTAPRRTEWNNAACLLTRRRFFGQIGPLREDGEFAHYKSDREWCQRLSAKLGLGHWVHPVRLRHFEKEVQRDPRAPFQATPDTRIAASVVMVAYGQLAYTREALDAILAHTRGPYELVLVDNGSRDGTREFFRSLRDKLGGSVAVQVIENEENRGYPIAANQGIRAARGRHVVLLNNDTRVKPGWLSALLDAAASGDRVGIVTAKILCPDGRVQNAGGIFHHPDGSFTLPFAHEDRLAPTVTERHEVESAGGPCMLLTRALLESVGVFDEAFSPAYFEDSDLCLRAREAGFTLVYEPAAEVFHHGKVTADVVAREGKHEIWRRFEENKRLFYSRWGRRLADDEAERREKALAEPLPRKRILLCANRPVSGPITPAVYCERALRREHDVVTAGRGQEVDLGPNASAREVVEAAGGAFDLLLVVEGDTFVPKGVSEAPCPTALWAIDNHIHASRPDGWHLAAAPDFEHVFCAQKDFVAAFAERGVTARWLPNACEPSLFQGPAAARDLDLVFVGHVLPIHARRRALLERLRRRFRVLEKEGVYGEEMAQILRRAKVVWNCSLAGDLNMRVFEGLAAGGLVVTDRIANGQDSLFADGEHLALYDDATLENVVERALVDAQGREEIAARGHRLATQHHTYEARMLTLLRTVVATAAPAAKRKLAQVTS
jgi:GT2 family glycosyltransferase/glycosyltransferase involved in cell wall biosynthesis